MGWYILQIVIVFGLLFANLVIQWTDTVIGSDVEPADIVSHDEDDVWPLLLLRGCRRVRHRHGKSWFISSLLAARDGRQPAPA
jgi:hypothetical protein